jgi:magnesium transporter
MLTRYQERDLTWIDMVAPTPQEVRALMNEFDIAPNVAQELLSASYKSKVERAGEAVYVILHFPTLRVGLNRRPEQEIDFIIGRKFLITARYENIDPLHTFAKAFEVGTLLGRNHAAHGGHLFASMVQNLYKSLSEECDQVRGKLEEIETRIFGGDERRMVFELSHVARALYDFSRALGPHREMLSSLEPAAGRLWGQEFSYYLREVEGTRARVEHELMSLRDSLKELRATNDSLLNTKQNEIMKNFTILAFLFLPLSFIAGVFGMNTEHNPIIGSNFDFWIIVAGMAFVAAACFVYFRHKDWF